MKTEILTRIDRERERQDALIAEGRIPWNCADPSVGDDVKLAVLTEEVGEVAKALLWIAAPDAFDLDLRALELVDELVQVAAVSVAWLEALQTRGIIDE